MHESTCWGAILRCGELENPGLERSPGPDLSTSAPSQRSPNGVYPATFTRRRSPRAWLRYLRCQLTLQTRLEAVGLSKQGQEIRQRCRGGGDITAWLTSSCFHQISIDINIQQLYIYQQRSLTSTERLIPTYTYHARREINTPCPASQRNRSST